MSGVLSKVKANKDLVAGMPPKQKRNRPRNFLRDLPGQLNPILIFCSFCTTAVSAIPDIYRNIKTSILLIVDLESEWLVVIQN